MAVARSVVVTILFIFLSSLFISPEALPLLHATTTSGEVCITMSATATACPASSPTIGTLAVGSTFSVGVFIQGSAPMGGFDIYVSADSGYLLPTSATLGSLIASPFATIICINDAAQPGSGACGVQTANGAGVVEVSTIDSSGSNECSGMSTCSGMAFTITYQVVAPIASTSISYPTGQGCSASSVADPPNVCVLVSDATGPTLPENVQGAIVAGSPAPLTAGFSYTPISPQAGNGVTFVGRASGGTSPYTYSWNFGDGTPGTGQVVSHAYSVPGRYSVTLNVTDFVGKSVESTQSLTVTPIPPLFTSFSFNPLQPISGQSVTFIASSSGGTLPYSFSWNFGDGSTGTGSPTSHTYATVGNYTVVLTVKDNGSPAQTVTSQQLVMVTSPPPQSAAGYTLSWQGYDWDGGHEETIYLNGNKVTSLPLTNMGSNGGAWASFSLNITSFVVQGTNRLTFAHAGWDCATSDNVRNLLITSGSSVVYSNSTSLPLSCAQSLSYTFTVGTAPPPPPPPPLSLSEIFDTANPIVGQTCSFEGFASGGVPPYSFNWDFGDHSIGFGSSVTHIYNAPGKYAVTLTVTDSALPSSTQSVTGYQTVSAPPPPSNGTYILSWQGYDWDGAGEETITLNGQIVTSLPGFDTPSNGGAWAPFSLNVTSYVVKGVNTLTFTHANWDCSTSDNVRNLQLMSGTTVVYNNATQSPLSCTQSLTYTFTV